MRDPAAAVLATSCDKALVCETQPVRRSGRVCGRLADFRNLLHLALGLEYGVLERRLSGELELFEGII